MQQQSQLRLLCLRRCPGTSSAPTLDQRPHCPRCPGSERNQDSRAPTAWPHSAGDQATARRPPTKDAKPGASQQADHTETLPGHQERPVVTRVRGRMAAGAGCGGECKETWVLSKTSSAWWSGTPSPLQTLRWDPGCCLIPCRSLLKLHSHPLPVACVNCSSCQHWGLDASTGDPAAGSPQC